VSARSRAHRPAGQRDWLRATPRRSL